MRRRLSFTVVLNPPSLPFLSYSTLLGRLELSVLHNVSNMSFSWWKCKILMVFIPWKVEIAYATYTVGGVVILYILFCIYRVLLVWLSLCSSIPGDPCHSRFCLVLLLTLAFLRTSMFTCSCEVAAHGSEGKMAPTSRITPSLSGFLSVVSAGVRDSVTSGATGPILGSARHPDGTDCQPVSSKGSGD